MIKDYNNVDGYLGRSEPGGQILHPAMRNYDISVERAINILDDPRFETPREHFNRALDFRYSEPPDYNGAIMNVSSAVRGVLQVVTGKKGVELNEAMQRIIPPFIEGMKLIYRNLYRDASRDTGGGESYEVIREGPTSREADVAIHTAAAAIRYSVIKYG